MVALCYGGAKKKRRENLLSPPFGSHVNGADRADVDAGKCSIAMIAATNISQQ
jgi:predicted RNA methylase